MRHIPLLLTIALGIFTGSMSFAAVPPRAGAKPSVQTTPAPAHVRLEMHLTRTDKEGNPGAEDTSPALPPAPPAIASPTLSTLDRGTATLSVTNKDLSYSISVSPAVEKTDKTTSTVQLLWNIQLSGRSLPGGTNAVITTGATRIDLTDTNESLLTEIPITDVKTGRISVFRLTVRVSVTSTDAATPKASPFPPAVPAVP